MKQRIIKFRAWDRVENKMGSIIECGFKEHIDLNEQIKNLSSGLVIMQYIGLKDNKRTEGYPEGKEIYEGDIVIEYGETYEVYYDKNDCQFRLMGISKKGRNHGLSWIGQEAGLYKIIGNIYEDSNLLK